MVITERQTSIVYKRIALKKYTNWKLLKLLFEVWIAPIKIVNGVKCVNFCWSWILSVGKGMIFFCATLRNNKRKFVWRAMVGIDRVTTGRDSLWIGVRDSIMSNFNIRNLWIWSECVNKRAHPILRGSLQSSADMCHIVNVRVYREWNLHCLFVW